MAHLPDFWGSSETASGDDAGSRAHRDDAGMATGQSSGSKGSSTSGARQTAARHASPLAGANLLGAVSTLLALTPRGRGEELARLTALAHGYIGIASEEELVRWPKRWQAART
jgi:hypothetical protein